ncbi:MAG: HAD hydrolase family protein [Gemmatimonadota bacterium]|nr:HAD hydrolase family protein [Gemmatimonadota bacterium]MDH3422947.1 HAD hydrolase family protein [Gemmatimonadota bacterium]
MTGPDNPVDTVLAASIELVVFDVDGVLTDAGVYMGATESGEAVELKRFDIQDGVGIKMLMWGGLDVALLSGRVSTATELRAKEIGVECHQTPDAYKMPAIEGLMARKGIGWDAVAMLGDDIPDLAVLRRVGLPAAVRNATAPVLGIAKWTSTKQGGRGAVREFCEALLEARGDLHQVIEAYVEERSGS